jgi:hypothetical protein
MNHFKVFQDALEKTFPSLTVFSDLNWDDVAREYIAAHDERPTDLDDFTFNFPQFLQDKASDGDCPTYLFELAYFELLQSQILENELILPEEKGLHLNPSLSFLNLEFDVGMMMDEATKGSVQILQRPHVLCLYSHPTRGLHNIEVTTPILETLQLLEEDSLENREAVPKHLQETLQKLIDLGVIVEITN